MRGWKVLASCSVAIMLLPVAQGQSKGTTDNEPFETFRVIDSKLTLLDSQWGELRKSLQDDQRLKKKLRSPWVIPARNVRATVASIQRLGWRLRSRYRSQHQKAAYRLFTSLDLKAHTMRRQLLALEHSRRRVAAKRFEERAEKTMLALVMQFQGISAGYAALHCEPLQWACGEVISSGRVHDAPPVKWLCVNTKRRCHGLPGPQTPTSVPHVVQRAPAAK